MSRRPTAMTRITIIDLSPATLGICHRRLAVPVVLLCSLHSLFSSIANLSVVKPTRSHDRPTIFAAASALADGRRDDAENTTPPSDDDDEDGEGGIAECQIYLAPSSYAENHLAAYAGVDIPPGQLIGGRSSGGEIGVPLVDFWLHNTRLPPTSTSNDPKSNGGGVEEEEEETYYHDEGAFDLLWTSDEVVSQFEDMTEADDGVVIIPGLGVLGTHHPGIVNAAWDHTAVLNRFRRPGPGGGGQSSAGVGGGTGMLDRRVDAGAGANSEFFDVSPRSVEHIHAGTEIFMDYGDEWVEVTESTYTDPRSLRRANFARADHVLRNYTEFVSKYPNMFETDEERQALWDIIISDVVSNPITKSLLPKNVTEAKRVAKVGSGIANNPDSLRSKEWLERNGICMDGLVGGRSTLVGAGRGAFATRFVPKGGLVAPGPMLRFYRNQLRVYETVGGGAGGADDDANATDGSEGGKNTADPVGKRRRTSKVVGRQLLLNYCFGHRDSSLLLFPYSTGVNLINHSSEMANVEIRWSKSNSDKTDTSSSSSGSKFHRGEWLRMSLSELGDGDYEKHPAQGGLMMDFVATRDINAGEEVLLNYGTEWEEAWEDHVRRWRPPPSTPRDGDGGAVSGAFASASVLNEEDGPFRTEEERRVDPYPPDVEIVCSCSKDDVVAAMDGDDGAKSNKPTKNDTAVVPPEEEEESEDDIGNVVPIGNANATDDDATAGGGDGPSYSDHDDGRRPILSWRGTPPLVEYPCTILEREEVESSSSASGGERQRPRYRYLVRIDAIDKKTTSEEEKKRYPLLKDVPHSHVLFVDRPYKGAMHDPGSFRHYIPIPDDMFPIYWMDRK